MVLRNEGPHIGADAHSGLVHTVVATAAHVGDVTQAHALLHGEESAVFGGAGYQGVKRREENRNTVVEWRVAMKRASARRCRTPRQGRCRSHSSG